jgi:hypothetical protein
MRFTSNRPVKDNEGYVAKSGTARTSSAAFLPQRLSFAPGESRGRGQGIIAHVPFARRSAGPQQQLLNDVFAGVTLAESPSSQVVVY